MGIQMDSTATADEPMTESTRPASRGPRLFIKEMVMRNFKSYAGEQRVGPFHKSFSAVVGPNGSGKSNVIDAMLFVFGKRAKQGEVEQISLMKPKGQGPHDEGFLEYLEDIIGTNKYVEKIDESFKELEALNEKRSGVVQMVKLAEKERESLEGVKNEAEDYMLKELSLLKWQEKATTLASENNVTEIAELQATVSSLESNVKIERGKIQENTKTLKELEALHVKYMKRQEELDGDLRCCKDEFKEFERQDLKHREDFKHLKQKIKKLDDKLEKHEAGRAAYEDAQRQINETHKRIETKTSSLKDIQNKLENLKLEASEARKMEQEKQAHQVPRLRERIVTPEGVPRLFDLIKVQDERMKLAFFAALGNTILAENIDQDIDKNSTEINRRKVQIETGQKTIKKLTKGIEESRNEKERLMGEKEKLSSTFKEIEQKAFIVQENYKKTQELIDQHKDVLDQAKSDYEKLKKIVDELRTSEVDAEYKLQDKRKACKELEIKGKAYKKKLDDLQVALSKHMEQIHKDLVDPEKLQTVLTDVTLGETCDLKRALEMVALLEAQLKDMNPNLDSISEYRKKVSLYNERVADLNLITQQRDDVKKQYDEWRKRRLDEFMAGFNTISLKLKEMYQMITLGGDAELELVDSLDPFSEGVVFSVRPPKKSWKNIANLSGGEKTLSSLALVFALHHYKPTPLYVMDEIDAALDFKNVSIVGHYVKDRTKDAQFIIISLRNNMFELADRLVGIYKTDNCTKSITINPGLCGPSVLAGFIDPPEIGLEKRLDNLIISA
ncbi:UNVERIFIED_CONTAM: Structural maintenance of chromosomes protein 4 [Sesamum calycinum]|uniref:Structural maintenance of chromosomes protein 4 n=1 Tax=Sesamum calycinum TaxID=2727403 RepID=A0AAW2MKN5_9LAMI